jgi:guanylate kinase
VGRAARQDAAPLKAVQERARDEHYGEYDYVIVNRDLEESVQKVRTILAARGCSGRGTRLPGFVPRLRADRRGLARASAILRT